MSLRTRLQIVTLGVALSFTVAISAGIAEETAKAEKTATPLPKSGSLSVSTSGGQSGVSAPSPWGDGDVIGGSSPISGSVSRVDGATWKLFIQNSSDDTYTANVEVVQKNDRGSRVKGDSFSYTLKPKAKESRTIASAVNASSAELNLRNWRNLSQEKKVKAEATAKALATPAVEAKSGSRPVPVSK